jgi:DNA-binding NarL/FixJ family response regulator
MLRRHYCLHGMRQPIQIKVLVAHSDPLISAGLCATLQKRQDFEVAACNRESGVSHPTVSHFLPPDVVVADYDSGLRLIAFNGASTDRVMILTHIHSETKICHALELGVRGYLLLGCSLEDLMQGIRSMHIGGISLAPLVASRIAERMKQTALTRREEGILGQIMLGLSDKAIAWKLTLALGTVKAHVKSILKKLDAVSRTEAVAIAQRRGIVGEEPKWSQLQVPEPGQYPMLHSALTDALRGSRHTRTAPENSNRVPLNPSMQPEKRMPPIDRGGMFGFQVTK